MSTVDKQITKDAKAELTRQLFAPVAEEMEQVEALLKQELHSNTPLVEELLRYGCLMGGKRMRPALVLLTAKALGEVNESHIKLAAVVEMIHAATLIHDDVLDEAAVRRHLATVNARWDNKVAVLLGDYLFTHSFHLASRTGSAFACEMIGAATNKVCEGELWQTGQKSNYELPEEEYLQIIGAKTSALTACSSRLGAHFAGADAETVEAMAQYGWDLGTAFQIADDLLDLVGDEAATGKSMGTDLAQRKPTLPIIHALAFSESDERRRMLELLSCGDESQLMSEIGAWIRRHGSIEYAHARAVGLAGDAARQLDRLPESPSRDVLALMCHLVVHRGH